MSAKTSPQGGTWVLRPSIAAMFVLVRLAVRHALGCCGDVSFHGVVQFRECFGETCTEFSMVGGVCFLVWQAGSLCFVFAWRNRGIVVFL